jgi:hypothetical protein
VSRPGSEASARLRITRSRRWHLPPAYQ